MGVVGTQGVTHLLCHRFVRGLPVGSAVLSQELVAAVVTEPVPGAVQYILHTKVRGLGDMASVGGSDPIPGPKGVVGPYCCPQFLGEFVGLCPHLQGTISGLIPTGTTMG